MNDEVLNHSPLIISETTLKEIMDNSDVIAPERLPETLERLNTLYALAVFYIRTSSRKVRTDFNKGISDLQRDIKQLSNSLDVHRWMFEPMRLAVLDDWFREKSQNADSALGTIKKPNNPLNNLADVHEPLEELANSLARLENMAQHYDRLNDGWDLLNWVRANGLGTAQIVRAELSSYFAKGGGIGPDTLILRHIAELYEYAFDRKFSIHSIVETTKYSEELGELNLESDDDQQKNRDVISDYSGPAVDFAVAVIHSLHLKNAFRLQESADPMDRRRISLTGERSATDLELSIRIGDLWTNDQKRMRKARRRTKGSASSKATRD